MEHSKEFTNGNNSSWRDSKELEQLLYVLDGWKCELSEGNQGNANQWLRHVQKAYDDIDNLKSIEEGLVEDESTRLQLDLHLAKVVLNHCTKQSIGGTTSKAHKAYLFDIIQVACEEGE